MDKKCTLIAAALMVAGVFSANAQSSTTVPEAQWKAGNYYYLKTGSSVLSLSCLLYTSPSPRDTR